jgi:hypothetical protein
MTSFACVLRFTACSNLQLHQQSSGMHVSCQRNVILIGTEFDLRTTCGLSNDIRFVYNRVFKRVP